MINNSYSKHRKPTRHEQPVSEYNLLQRHDPPKVEVENLSPDGYPQMIKKQFLFSIIYVINGKVLSGKSEKKDGKGTGPAAVASAVEVHV